MRRRSRLICAALTAFVIFFSLAFAQAGTFVAFSLKEAQRQMQTQAPVDSNLLEVGGITRPFAVVYDADHDDMIIIGEAVAGEEGITLDDLVVAMRAVIVREVWPEVDMYVTTKNQSKNKQAIRYEGGIENTQFGKNLQEGDVVLKRLVMGFLSTEVWGFKSYFALRLEHMKKNPQAATLKTKFFLYPETCQKAARDGIFVLRDFSMGVQARLEGFASDNGSLAKAEGLRNDLAEQFAQEMTANLADVCVAYPELAKVRTALREVGLAFGIKTMAKKPDLSYWLKVYKVSRVETTPDYPLLRQAESVVSINGESVEVVLEGGIQLKVLQSRLCEDGDTTALRDIVLGSRPSGSPLSWSVPLGEWRLPGYENDSGPEKKACPEDVKEFHAPGCSVNEHLAPCGEFSKSLFLPPCTMKPMQLPQFDNFDRLRSQRFSPNVGGILLNTSSNVLGTGRDEAGLDLSEGTFSIVLEGMGDRMSSETHRKFVTALWAVYYDREDPGVSIDPIAPGVDRHMVRYLGKVINTDLGRIMREADYLMKCWAVGTERPDIPGFNEIEVLAAGLGGPESGISRRIFFVPEDMTFTRSGGMLLFSSGRMRVKTEYLLSNMKGQSNPADDSFADFFTSHYDRIAENYPVYKDLFNYAKLVSLAQYLKEQGIPLHWYLMAHKDLVITEDSPGTVEELMKGSPVREGVVVCGGVELGGQGKYVYDEKAIQAVQAALAIRRQSNPSHDELHSNRRNHVTPLSPVSFEVDKGSYSIVPQHTAACSKDIRGIRYQTDLAVRASGHPGIEIVRFFDPSGSECGEFGNGWRLLVPYRLWPADSSCFAFAGAMIPEKMGIENLLTGQMEILAFDTDRFGVAAYVPVSEKSQTVGLFLMSDTSFRLVDKLQNEFQFDAAGYLTDMVFSEDQHFHFDYVEGFTNAFEKPPYQLLPADGESLPQGTAFFPRQMKVLNLVAGSEEMLELENGSDFICYKPKAGQNSEFGVLAVMADSSFRLIDKEGNEIAFDGAGKFRGATFSSNRRMVSSVSMGRQRVVFRYTVDRQGRMVIASLRFYPGTGGGEPAYVVRYSYDEAGNLAWARPEERAQPGEAN